MDAGDFIKSPRSGHSFQHDRSPRTSLPLKTFVTCHVAFRMPEEASSKMNGGPFVTNRLTKPELEPEKNLQICRPPSGAV